MSHSSVLSMIQEQTQLRAPAICHLSPVLSLQAELWWDSAAADTWRAVSGEAMQKGDYSLLFTMRELGSIWISQQVKTQKKHYFHIRHNRTVEFVTMWFGGDKRFGWLPKAIRKHYGREMQCLVITVTQWSLRLVAPPDSSPWKGQFRPFLYHSAMADSCCVRTQMHKNQFSNFHVSYDGFKAISFVGWEDFGLLLIFNLSSKRPRRMKREGSVYACRIYYHHLLWNSVAIHLVQHSVCKITSVWPQNLCIEGFYSWSSHTWWWEQPQRHCSMLVTGHAEDGELALLILPAQSLCQQGSQASSSSSSL